jgi:hypothetical protein
VQSIDEEIDRLKRVRALLTGHAASLKRRDVIRGLVGLKPTDPASESVRKQIVSGEI